MSPQSKGQCYQHIRVAHARAAGGVVDPQLLCEVKRLQGIPLGEGPGEGFHRATNHEHVRAPGARTPHLLATPVPISVWRCAKRSQGSIHTCLIQRFALIGKNHKRLLRPSIKYEWKPVKLSDKN